MSERTEKAILAGGCFWGMQDLIRKRPGVLSTRVGYTGGDVPNATYRNHGPRRGDRDHLRPRADVLSRSARVLLPDPRPHDARPPGQRRGHELPLGDLLPRRRAAPVAEDTSPTSKHQGSGRARSSPRSARPGRSGRPNPSTRTTWSTIPTATRATSRARDGCCRDEATSSLITALAALWSRGRRLLSTARRISARSIRRRGVRSDRIRTVVAHSARGSHAGASALSSR